MKVTVDRAALLAGLKLCALGAEKRSTIPILNNVRITTDTDRLDIVATDLNLTVFAGCEAKVIARGGFTVAASEFTNAIRAASDDLVELVAEETAINITCGSASFRLPTLPIADYPTLPEREPDKPTYEFQAAALIAAVSSSTYAMTHEETRFQIDGVLLAVERNGLDVCATDGHRMVIYTLPGRFGKDATVMLPSKLARIINRLSGEFISITTGHQLWLSSEDVTFAARVIDVNFPHYRNVIAVLDYTLRVDRRRLAGATKAALLASPETSRGVRMDVTAGRMTMSAADGVGRTASLGIPVDYSGPDFFVGMSGRYLAEALENVNSPYVEIQAKDKDTQIQIRPGDDEPTANVLHVIMPMRL